MQAVRDDGRVFEYDFDAASNLVRTTVFRPDGSTVTRQRTFTPDTHRLDDDGTGARATWSDGGNLLALGGREYSYDADAQLRDVWERGELIESHVSDHARHEVVSVRRAGSAAVAPRPTWSPTA